MNIIRINIQILKMIKIPPLNTPKQQVKQWFEERTKYEDEKK